KQERGESFQFSPLSSEILLLSAMPGRHRRRPAGTLVAAAAITYLVGQCRVHASDEVQFTTPYQLVVFTNSVSYFGKLEGFGGPHPVLRDVYYVVTQTDPQSKKTNNILVKRGKEWHEPGRMDVNPSQILTLFWLFG